MRSLARRAAISAVGLAGAAALTTPAVQLRRPTPDIVPLASSVLAPHRPTTVLVHGLDSSRETFAGTVAELAAMGYPAVALDLRGHGESALGPEAAFSPQSLARDVLAAVAALVPSGRGVVLVGHSMGGRVAMRCSALDCASGLLCTGQGSSSI